AERILVVRIIAGRLGPRLFQRLAVELADVRPRLPPPERQEAVVFEVAVLPKEAGGEVAVGVLQQLFVNLHLLVAGDRLARRPEVRLVIVPAWSGRAGVLWGANVAVNVGER